MNRGRAANNLLAVLPRKGYQSSAICAATSLQLKTPVSA